MKTKNKVQLIGYLGRDPDIITFPVSKTKARLRLATDHYRRDDSGTAHRVTTWHDVIVWNKLAESIPNQYIKGSHVLVEGRIEYRSFINKNGTHKTVVEIHATELLNLDR